MGVPRVASSPSLHTPASQLCANSAARNSNTAVCQVMSSRSSMCTPHQLHPAAAVTRPAPSPVKPVAVMPQSASTTTMKARQQPRAQQPASHLAPSTAQHGLVVFKATWTPEQLAAHQAGHTDRLWLTEEGLITLEECGEAQVMTLCPHLADELGFLEADRVTITPATVAAATSHGPAQQATTITRTSLARLRVGAQWQMVGVSACEVADLQDILPIHSAALPLSAALSTHSMHSTQQSLFSSPSASLLATSAELVVPETSSNSTAEEPLGPALETVPCSELDLPTAFSLGTSFPTTSTSTNTPSSPAAAGPAASSPEDEEEVFAGFTFPPAPAATAAPAAHGAAAAAVPSWPAAPTRSRLSFDVASSSNSSSSASRKQHRLLSWSRSSSNLCMAAAAVSSSDTCHAQVAWLSGTLPAPRQPYMATWPWTGACAAAAGALQHDLARLSDAPAMKTQRAAALLC